MTDMTTALVPEHLAKLWNEGDRERALIFLRRALLSSMTIGEWLMVFNFEGVKPHVDSIRIREIFQHPSMSPQQIPTSSVPSSAKQLSLPEKRTRRSAQEMEELKKQLLKFVAEEPGTIDTTQLSKELEKSGHKNVGTVIVNNLMNDLLQEKKVLCKGGRPKAYCIVKEAGGLKAVPPTIVKGNAAAQA